MKIKKPKKPRTPSAKFLEAKRAREDAEQRTVPQSGPVNVFLDDERHCPAGWTLARTPAEFWNIIKGPSADRIERIALDWHLGTGVIENGVGIATKLADMMRGNETVLPALEVINLHSSDRDKAIEMARILQDISTPQDADWYRFRLDIGPV